MAEPTTDQPVTEEHRPSVYGKRLSPTAWQYSVACTCGGRTSPLSGFTWAQAMHQALVHVWWMGRQHLMHQHLIDAEVARFRAQLDA